MRVVIERVKNARLNVGGNLVSEIGHGLVVFVGVVKNDTAENVAKCAKKLATIRIFTRDEKLNDSVRDVAGEILLVSNFTLCTVETSGARPDFSFSAEKDKAVLLYNQLAEALRSLGVKVKMGVFGADMQIETTLDGPITIFKEF